MEINPLHAHYPKNPDCKGNIKEKEDLYALR